MATKTKDTRAVRRRAERTLKKAGKQIVQAEQTLRQTGGPVPQQPGAVNAQPGGGIPVDMKDLLSRIGSQLIQMEYWQGQAQQYAVALGKMQAKWAGQPDPEGYVDPDAPTQADILGAAGVPEAPTDSREAEAGQTPEEQAAADAEAFPELQDTDGNVVQEEGRGSLEEQNAQQIAALQDEVELAQPAEVPTEAKA